MKNLFTTSLVCVALLATACKKDKPAKIQNIGGEYIMYDLEKQNPYEVHSLPAPTGEHGKIVIQLLTDSTAKATLLLYDKNNQAVINKDYYAAVGKDGDGDIVLQNNDGLVAYIFEDYDMDFYAVDNYRFGAKK